MSELYVMPQGDEKRKFLSSNKKSMLN